jgi:hypothetical protein
MSLSRKAKSWIAVGIFVAAWWGIPTYHKWRADRLVDELCAKDGGMKVFETVTMPYSYFTEMGQPNVDLRAEPIKSKFHFNYEESDIVGDKANLVKLAVYRIQIDLLRRSDEKILGQYVYYARRGGDPYGPWHPSSYGCPQNKSEWDMARAVVIRRPKKR